MKLIINLDFEVSVMVNEKDMFDFVCIMNEDELKVLINVCSERIKMMKDGRLMRYKVLECIENCDCKFGISKEEICAKLGLKNEMYVLNYLRDLRMYERYVFSKDDKGRIKIIDQE